MHRTKYNTLLPQANFSPVEQVQKQEWPQTFLNVQMQLQRVFVGKYPSVSQNNFLSQSDIQPDFKQNLIIAD